MANNQKTLTPRISVKKSKRIGFDARYINDRYHGIGRFAFRLLEAMVNLAPQHTFVVFRGQASDSRFDWNKISNLRNVQIERGPWPLYWPQEQILWPNLLHRNKIDLFHSPYFVTPLLMKIPKVITVHDLIFDRYPQYMPAVWSRPYYRALMRLSTRQATKIICVSQATGRDLTQFYAIPASKITTIPEAVEPGFQPLDESNDTSRFKQQYHLDRPFILTVGARRPHKNMARLVEAFTHTNAQSELDLVIAGPADPRFPDVARQAALSYDQHRRVHFLGWIPEEDLPTLYNLAELVVLPSLIEGFGLPALEAMACNVPVVAADRTSFPEVVGKAGVLVNPLDTQALAEAIDKVILSEELQLQLISAGRKRVAGYSWEQSARMTLTLYSDILNQ